MGARFDKQRLAVGRLYAGATRKLAAERGIEAELLDELEGLLEVLDANVEHRELFLSPLVDPEERHGILERAFRGRLNDLVVDTLQVMNKKRRLDFVREFIEAYRLEYEEAHGIVEVEVYTAVPLSEELRERTRTIATERLATQVLLVEEVDPSVLGGFVLKVGDRKIDSSIARDLAILGESLIERSSQEVMSGTAWVTPDDAVSE